jgi:putative oxidoreductase
MTDFALFLLRLTLGGFMAGHGAQKLFGWFKGPGLKGTRGFMESLGMRPAGVWGNLVAVGETSGGVFTALGLLGPMGPLNIMSSMVVATRRAHWKVPLWVSAGGSELAVTNLTAATVLAVNGPGRYSLDSMLGIRVPTWLKAMMWVNAAAVTVVALQRPEIAETAMNSVTSKLPTTFRPANAPDLEVETRPASESTQPMQTQV